MPSDKDSGPATRARAENAAAGRGPICVIIAAKDAETSIARAVGSALDQPETGEVVVVDDGSSDATAAIAGQVDDPGDRVRVVRLETNRGPAAARNVALDCSSAPLVAVLDADDVMMPGRFAALLDGPAGWDALADNVVFVSEEDAAAIDLPRAFEWSGEACALSPARFILGNIARANRPRGELGFLKPVIRRAFLDKHALRYDESLRLGEDFDLYVRMLMAGARFRLSNMCGYVAAERAGSLSAAHRPQDLEALMRADDALLVRCAEPATRAALERHRAHVAARWHHRALLARRHDVGVLGALSAAARHPQWLVDGLAGIARDKVAKFLPALTVDAARTPRFLVPAGGERERALLARLSRPASRI